MEERPVSVEVRRLFHGDNMLNARLWKSEESFDRYLGVRYQCFYRLTRVNFMYPTFATRHRRDLVGRLGEVLGEGDSRCSYNSLWGQDKFIRIHSFSFQKLPKMSNLSLAVNTRLADGLLEVCLVSISFPDELSYYFLEASFFPLERMLLQSFFYYFVGGLEKFTLKAGADNEVYNEHRNI